MLSPMSKKPNIYLIGGAPRVGKSTLASLLARQLSTEPIATDDLRTQIRSFTAPATEPDLYYLDSLNVDEANMTRLMRDHTKDIIAAADRESTVVWRSIEILIQAHATSAQPLIIEGVAILPHLVAGLRVPHTAVHLGNQSPAHAKIILDFARNNPNTWLGTLQTDTLEAFAKFTQHYSVHAQAEAQKYHQPYLEMNSQPFEESLEKALDLLQTA